MTWRWVSSGITHTGKRRRCNQDAILQLDEGGLWVVADGMGGHRDGALASRLVTERLAALPALGGLENRVEWMQQHLLALNHELHPPSAPATISGSTVVALLIQDAQGICAWAGDSRCYLWRSGMLHQLSRDHSLAQHLIDTGACSVEEAYRHRSAQALTRALGASSSFELQIIEFDLYPDDCLLLCSDGLYRELPASYLTTALASPSAQLAARRLAEGVLGGAARDNFSAIVVTHE